MSGDLRSRVEASHTREDASEDTRPTFPALATPTRSDVVWGAFLAPSSPRVAVCWRDELVKLIDERPLELVEAGGRLRRRAA